MSVTPSILYAVQPLPERPGPTVFLAGPTPRDPATPSWRPEAIRLLGEAGFAGTVIVPETSDGEWRQSYDDQVDWECEMRSLADVIAFWVPRDMASMPALTTNVEFGEDLSTGRMIYGRPDAAPKNKYLDHRWTGRSGLAPFADLPSLVAAASKAAMAHSRLPERVGGTARVPAQAWASEALRKRLNHLTRNAELAAFRVERAVSGSWPFTTEQGIKSPVSDPSVPFWSFTARFAMRYSGETTFHHLVHVDLKGTRLVEDGWA
jgi:hypothetical protein